MQHAGYMYLRHVFFFFHLHQPKYAGLIESLTRYMYLPTTLVLNGLYLLTSNKESSPTHQTVSAQSKDGFPGMSVLLIYCRIITNQGGMNSLLAIAMDMSISCLLQRHLYYMPRILQFHSQHSRE